GAHQTRAVTEQRAAGASFMGFLACHCAGGIVGGWTTLGVLLWLDVAGLGGLVMGFDLFPVPLLMLLVAFATTFGGVATGSAIMAIGRSSAPGGPVARGLPRPGPVLFRALPADPDRYAAGGLGAGRRQPAWP